MVLLQELNVGAQRKLSLAFYKVVLQITKKKDKRNKNLKRQVGKAGENE